MTTQLGMVLLKVSLLLVMIIENKLLEELPEQHLMTILRNGTYCKHIRESHVCLPYFDLDSLEKKLAV